VKRGAPRADHYIRVDAGQSVSTEINLLEGYDIYESGNYSLRFDSRLLDLGTGTPETMARKQVFQPKLIRSNQTQFRVLETLPRHKRALGEAGEAGEGVAPKVPAFTDCTQEQQDILTQALADAQNYAMGTHVGLLGVSAGDRPNSPRYKKWFGAYSESRYNTVMTHFEKIYNALANETITFHCDCDEDYYAYVYPNQPYHIYLCNAFWSAPATGSDSRMGTLIHETSHFTIVAGTDDHAYGQSSCQSLAQNDPARAVDNADNHEYIAENNPSDPWKDSGVEHVPFALLAILAVVTLFWFYSRKRLPGAAG
jgi:peptidyl-Lys metalloendopeptidase